MIFGKSQFVLQMSTTLLSAFTNKLKIVTEISNGSHKNSVTFSIETVKSSNWQLVEHGVWAHEAAYAAGYGN